MSHARRRRTDGCASVSRRVGLAAAFALLLVAAGCRHAGAPSASPVAPVPAGEVHVSFRVYNSALGEVRSAATTVTFEALGTEVPDTVGVPINTFSLDGVDPVRAAVYQPHTGSRLGRFVTATTDGVIRLPRVEASYDLFLMSTASGARYADIDVGRPTSPGTAKRYATMRTARPGESLLGQNAVSESDESFRFEAAEFTRALNPFGLEYGRLDFLGSTGSADVTSGWVAVDPQTCEPAHVVPGTFWVNHVYVPVNNEYPYLSDARCFETRSYVPKFWGDVLIVYGLAQAYLGATGGLYPCLLVSCGGNAGGFYYMTARPPLSSSGADVVRYLALMNGGLQ